MLRPALLTLVAAVAVTRPVLPQSRSEVGIGLEYVALLGTWPVTDGNGVGPVVFLRRGSGPWTAGAGLAVTLHRNEFLQPDWPYREQGPSGTLETLTRGFLELRYHQPGEPLLPFNSIAARLGGMHTSSFTSPWVLYYEAVVTSSIPLGPRPELSLGAGRVRFSGQPRSAHTLSIGTALTARLSP
ncbi:MAG TPA: hypothetical protein VD793_08400 [Gemmatimonadales bacterium]|nr:hypothetical protein [Gemmatimonadales bacterium]